MSRKLIATVGDTHTCPMFTGTSPHVGGTIITGSATILANNRQVARMGDKCLCTGCGMTATIIQGDANVLVDGKPVAFVGCMTSHGGVITSGQPNAFLSGSKPTKLATMPIDEIEFPSIKYRDRVMAMLKGQSKNLETAEKNIESIKKIAPKQEPQENIEKKLPKLQGEIIFVIGYLSSPAINFESHMNAIKDRNPDEHHHKRNIGENTSEDNRINDKDIYSAKEKNYRDSHKTWTFIKDEIIDRVFKGPSRIFKFSADPDDKYTNYWNQKANDNKATKIYAKHFNAENRVNFINGSHGLSSSGAHRIDHGIALGYKWASVNWGIKRKEYVENLKDEKPEVESKSPHYKPVTIVGHSQGACMAAGVKLGVIKYALDQGWEKVAINTIFLGTHQPRGLHGKDYIDLVTTKKDKYFVNQNAISTDKKEKGSNKLLNKLSESFSEEHLKFYNKRGLIEHIKKISYDWEAYKSRAIQFAFANDRGDLVTLDGDIPEIKNACSLKPNTSLFSTQYFHTKEEIPNDLTNYRKVDLQKDCNGKGGYILIPKYSCSERFEYKKMKTESEKKYGVRWNNYESLAISWGKSMYNFLTYKNIFENEFGKYDKEFGGVIGGRKKKKRIKKRIKENIKKLEILEKIINLEQNEYCEKRKDLLFTITSGYYAIMLLNYSSLQGGDLYAHFAPVAYITHPKLLQDQNGDFTNDQYGDTSIFDRIIKAGEDRFYRVDYEEESGKKLTDEQKMKKDKSYVKGKEAKKHLISTSIASHDYIQKVIDAFYLGNKDAETDLHKLTLEDKKKYYNEDKKKFDNKTN